jgi:predicted TIM-barrel fold metal-dependent hydrolase
MTVTQDRTEQSDDTGQVLYSSDSHVKVTHEKVKTFLASKYHDAYDAAAAKFTRQMQSGAGAVNQAWETKRKHEPDWSAFRLRNMERPGHWEPKARIEDMDTDGIEKEVLYCEVSGFRYLYALEDGVYDAVKAFNDAMHDFAIYDPARLIMSYQIPIHDIDIAVKEVQRVAAMGGESLQLPVFPPEVGLPDYYHERYDPLFAAIQEADLPITCHVGLNTNLSDLTHRDPTPDSSIMVCQVALCTGEALGMWSMTGIFERFPGLKVVFVEPGLGWVAWYIYIADDLYERQGYNMPDIKEKPSHYFHQNMFFTFIDEPDALQSEVIRNRIGVENIMWSSDYPHPVTSWPNSRKIVNEQFAHVTPEEKQLMVYGNTKRVWNL